jgi:hypothetical protein
VHWKPSTAWMQWQSAHGWVYREFLSSSCSLGSSRALGECALETFHSMDAVAERPWMGLPRVSNAHSPKDQTAS